MSNKRYTKFQAALNKRIVKDRGMSGEQVWAGLPAWKVQPDFIAEQESTKSKPEAVFHMDFKTPTMLTVKVAEISYAWVLACTQLYAHIE